MPRCLGQRIAFGEETEVSKSSNADTEKPAVEPEFRSCPAMTEPGQTAKQAPECFSVPVAHVAPTLNPKSDQ
jgi:hypothetical protein